ncbi:MAG: flavodoxin family protein [Oscillospiraceae bacterium]|nr:flavodoxin family protein [Oscillospiraceae bacterium]
MKALFFNGSPRKNWTTVKMLDNAMKGAADAGAEVELIHLYDYDFKGCKSCFACKLKNSKTNGVCAIRDDLRPILEKAHEADVIVIGSPIYFSYPTGEVRSFMERLMFPILSYNAKVDEVTGEVKSSLLGKFVPTAMIYTMGVPSEQWAADCHYPEIFGENERFLKQLFGYTETLCTYNSYQFSDYSKYDIVEGTQERRAAYRDEQFPKDLENAYQLGQRLVQKAEANN